MSFPRNFIFYPFLMSLISPEKQQEIRENLLRLSIRESDIRETFVRGSGSGGQKKNKTSNCVVLSYPPLDITVRCERERERETNRWLARRLLAEKVDQQKTGKREDVRTSAIHKRRKQKKRAARKRRANQEV